MPLARRLPLAVALCLLPISVPAARAAWIPQGNPVCTAPGTQQQISGCGDGAGGVYVVWADGRSGAAQVYAQHLFGDGSIAPGWPVGGVQLTSSLLAQAPAAVPDGGGGLLVIAQVGSNLVALRVDPSGALAPAFPVNGVVLTSDLANRTFAAAPDGAGGAWVLRAGGTAVNGVVRLRLTRVTRDGTFAPGWTANGVTLVTGVNLYNPPHLEADAAGGVVASVMYHSFSSDQNFCLLARVRANGVITQSVQPPTVLSGNSTIEDALAVPDGHAGMLAVWAEIPNPGEALGFATHWDSTGASLWPPAMQIGKLYSPTPYRIVSDGSGGAYLVETRPVTALPFVLRVSADGTTAPGWGATGVPMGGLLAPEIAFLRTPSGVLSFWSSFLSSDLDLSAMLVNSNGTLASGWNPGGNTICNLPGKQSSPLLIADDFGGVIGCWLDQRDQATTEQDVYATRLVEPPPPVATDAALVEASAEPDRVLLHWWSADGAGFAAVLERETGAAGWSRLADLGADASGAVRYEDRDVAAGTTYGYRLVVTNDGARRILGETRITVPAGTAFALEPIRPNPSSEAFAVAFTLPDARPVRIDLVDLAGRLVRSETFAPGRAGRFVLRRELAGAPGVYLLRLTQGGVSRTTRLVHAD